MRVALITPGGVDPGAEERSFPYLLALIERLARNHDVQVFSLHQGTQPATYPLAGATVHDAGVPPGAGRRRAYLRTARSIIAHHRRAPFDLLHAFWLVPPGLIAVVAGQLIRRPVLVHVAGGELVAFPDIAYGWQLSWRTRMWTLLALAGASAVTAATMPLLEQIKRRGKRAERVPFGVDLHRWPPLPPRPRQAGAPARIVHVAALNPVKDQATLLHAAAELAKSVPFELDIAGFDTMNGRIQALAASLGLSGRVRFHGHLRHQELRPLVEKADLFWLASRHEAGPVAVLEAAVAGVPTVGTAVGHVAEWAPDAAVSVPVRAAEALARETAALLADEPRRMRIATDAQRRAVAEDADWTARRVETMYQTLA